MKRLIAVVVILLLVGFNAWADQLRTHPSPGLGNYDTPFWPGGEYRDAVQSPNEFLGFELGSRPASHEEIVRYFTYLGDNFSNAKLIEFGHTYEGRSLNYLIVTSEENAQRLDEIQSKNAKLADPRMLANKGEANGIIADNPAIAWLAYGIHGDELSSCDAAVQFAYQLVAGTDDVTERIRDQVVVCIDPMENPDGRTRWLTQLEQWNAVTPVPDVQSFNHRGQWPFGRTNHYLFDLNRDWFALVHPESRGRARAILEWNPQLLVDAHEMGSLDTYLFSPPREPFNPFMTSHIHKWWAKVAEDQASAFDRYGWSYYTREWNEEFFPGYGSSWGIYVGAIGMLYEQARAAGSLVKRRDGTIMTYRETVHHQFASSMANVGTMADNRQELLRDYHEDKRRAVGLSGKGRNKNGAFVIAATENTGRLERFAETLQRQKIEVRQTTESFNIRNALSAKSGKIKSQRISEGSLIVPLSQPLRPLIEAILTFDIRIPTHVLEEERKERLKHNRSRMYESTAWSLPLAYNLDSYYVDSAPRVASAAYRKLDRQTGIENTSPNFGYAFNNDDDRSYVLLARLFDHGYRVWGARKPFEVGAHRFESGSFLIKNTGNPNLDESHLESLARETGVQVHGVNTALGRELADLGGSEFVLLQRPRIGLIGGPNVSTYDFGAIWHMLDSRIGYRTSTLNVTGLGGMDLRKYNVLVLPQTANPGTMKQLLGETGIKKMRTWIESGGTLVATGSGSAFLADSSVALSAARQKRQVLKQISKYDSWLEWSMMAESPEVDSLDMWEPRQVDEPANEESKAKRDEAKLKEADELARRLRPQGAILAAELDATHWLAFGARGPVPVLVSTGYALVTKSGVEVAARFAPEHKIRLSGMLWPEARKRWAQTVYATRESVGSGQVILFAGQPNFRGYFHGGERLLQNAIFLGPGFGTSTPLEW